MLKKISALSLLAVPVAACAYPSISEISAPPQVAMVDVKVDQGKAVPIEVVEKTWKCPGCTDNEKYVLEQLQERTKISDRNALATILGNIKSESNFTANICEGGARVSYKNCLRGGYGLIQWTSTGRYNGLGKFAKRYGCDPSTLPCQTRYMINEPQFQKILPEFEGHGQPIHQYMVGAYYWLGWGIKGYREQYAHNYAKKLVWS
jgi:hypothetical protein